MQSNKRKQRYENWRKKFSYLNVHDITLLAGLKRIKEQKPKTNRKFNKAPTYKVIHKNS